MLANRKRLDVAVGRGDRRRKADERPAGGCTSSGLDAPAAAMRARLSAMTSSMKRVMTRRVSSWMTRGLLEAGMEASISLSSAGEERRVADLGEIEQAGAQAVVDVVRVIGDVVGDRRRLRLEARMQARSRGCRRS